MPSSNFHWKRPLLSISALLLISYLVASCLPSWSSYSSYRLFVWSSSSSSLSTTTMDPSTALQVKITSATPQNTDVQQGPIVVKVKVSVYNSADTLLTLLRWGTPLDPASGVLGVFEVRSLEGKDNGQALHMDTIKISRKLPPMVDDLVEIPAGSALEAVVTLPPLQLHAGREYTVVARGRWQVIWEGRMSDVTPENLETLADAKAGEFVSDRAVVKVE